MADTISRRSFIKSASAASAAAATGLAGCRLPAPRSIAPVPRGERLRLGLIGCGGRGTGAVVNAFKADPDVELVAMGDVFMRQVERSRSNLTKESDGRFAERVKVTDAACFDGLDAYRRVIEHPEVDIVVHATSPGFRARHLEAIVAAKKHCFIEKPACVDPVAYRSVLASAQVARENGTAIVTGTQFRRSNNYADAIAAIHEGAIGDVLFAQARYCSRGIWYRKRQPGMADTEYQIHNWYHFLWLSGDQICEQALHNLDAINWAMGSPPAQALGLGGQRLRPADSEIYDCMSVDYLYPNDAVLSLQCWQQPSRSEVSNLIVGTKGRARIMPFGTSTITSHDGRKILEVKYRGDAYTIEHANLIASIRSGQPIVEAEEMAHSSLTAVMGRMAAYTGEQVTWDFVTQDSKLDLMPATLDLKAPLPSRGVPAPGRTRLV